MKSRPAAILLTLILSLPLQLFAQDSSLQSEAQTGEPAEAEFSGEITPLNTPPTPFENVDSFFADVVGAMAEVLFYKILTDERETLTYSAKETYVRFGRTADAFRPLYPDQENEFDSINVVELDRLANEGRTLTESVIDGETKPYARGTLSTRPIEYIELTKSIEVGNVTVPTGATFVRVDENTFQRVGPKRNLPDANESIPANIASELATRSDDFTLATTTAGGMPLVVLWLLLGAIFFTVRMGFVNIWAFGHAIKIVSGKYDNPEETGEVTHAQALASALSATVGLGNIAGVTLAMTAGGPGAFFWMMLAAAFGMSSKFVECTLAQKYRKVKADGTVLGGPMRYLRVGLSERGWPIAGSVLGVVFSVMCVLASFGGGNMFQANQSAATFVGVFQAPAQERLSEVEAEMAVARDNGEGVVYQDLDDERTALVEQIDSLGTIVPFAFGIVMAILVGIVILGGIKRIGKTAEKIVPAMCGIYLLACLFIIARHVGDLPALVATIFAEAWSGEAVGGGFLGAMIVAVTGVQRAAFSNEAGIGSAAIAHSAAKTEEPVREGCVALLGPFLDTIVVCSMTALVILITGVWDSNELIVEQGLAGAQLTSAAFRQEISWFPYVLSGAVILFAFSTIISWSYYGEKAWEDLFGARSIPVYKILAVLAVVLGSVVNLGSVLDFSDMMILSMAFPNILGAAILSGAVKADLRDYWQRLKAGDFDREG